MVNDPSTDSMVSWSQEFHLLGSGQVLHRCSSKVWAWHLSNVHWSPSPHLYCFRKVEESVHCEYAHEYFVRGKPELTVEIERQFKERCAPKKYDIKPPEPGYKEKRERLRALVMANKAARRLSLKE